ncbi:MAG: 3-ketoacyl-ACP reductase, partial [Eubacteriales bacterium]
MKKTAIVTGGSRGIGFAIAQKLGHDGFSVAILARRAESECRENMEVLRAAGIDFAYFQCDISDARDRENCLNKILQKFGSISILVNNAGVAPKVRTDLLQMTEESFDTVMSVNLKGPLFLTQMVAVEMLKNHACEGELKGIIVNIGSISAELSSVNRAEYCISKAGMGMMTTVFADRLASEGIRVYEVRPGITKTDMTAGVQGK